MALNWLLTIVNCATIAMAYPDFVNRIPNGGNVPNSCSEGSTWSAPGHKNPSGGGATNVFGTAFESAGNSWTAALCQADSDGDGKTNGEELGDPNCTWQKGDTNPTGSPISHPAICEPITSDQCKTANSWVSSCGGTSTASSNTGQSSTSEEDNDKESNESENEVNEGPNSNEQNEGGTGGTGGGTGETTTKKSSANSIFNLYFPTFFLTFLL